MVPAHLAFVLLNEGAGNEQPGSGGMAQRAARPLFASVIEQAGGDPVSYLAATYSFYV